MGCEIIMKKIEIYEVENYSEKAYKCTTYDDVEFFVPKSAVIHKDEYVIIVEDWLSLDDDVEYEECSLMDLVEQQQPNPKYLTGIEYKFNEKCLEFQNEAIEYCVARRFALINLWTGAGKTFIYLGIIDALGKDNNIMIVPSNLVKQMEGEIAKHFPHLQGKIAIITYSELSLKKISPEMIDTDTVVVFDEVHRVKNAIALKEPKVSKIARQIAERAGYVYGGTATPSPNGAHDLLGIMTVIHQEFRHMTMSQIRKNFCRIRGMRIVALKKLIDFCRYISPYVFYRHRDDYENLEYEEHNHVLSLDDLESEQYRRLWELNKKSDIEMTLFGAMSLMKRNLYKATEGGVAKRKALLDIVNNTTGQVIIFVDTVNTNNAEAEQVANELGLDKCAFLTGNRKTIDDFIEGRKRFLICSYGSGSEGLNLQFCSTIVFYGHNFNYTTKKQAYGRILRYGQQEVCHYHNIYYTNSVEGAYIKSLTRKENIMKEYNKAFNKLNFLDKIAEGESENEYA